MEYKKRRYWPGLHGKEKCPAIGAELFQWLVDTIFNMQSRISPSLLKQQAKVIAKSYENLHPGVALPNIDGTWMRRWRRQYGVAVRSVNLRYKVSRSKLKSRIGVMLRNNTRLRPLHEKLLGFGKLRVLSMDQKPFLFNSVGSKSTFALRGAKKSGSRRT